MYQSIQGNLGLGKAVEYFTSHNIPIAIPLNDTQKYDLIADMNGELKRISVKTGRGTRTNGASYAVMLRNIGGSSGNYKNRPFDNTACDYLFCVIGDNRCFLIPAKDITATNTITIGTKYTEYEVKSKTLNEYDDEMRQISTDTEMVIPAMP